MLVHGLSLISPGPDFLLVLRSSILYSTYEGRRAACGVVLGNAVFITLAAIGFTLLGDAHGTSLLKILKVLGALYLIFFRS